MFCLSDKRIFRRLEQCKLYFNFYLADDPDTLPGPEINPEPMVIELIEEELPAIVAANHTFEAPEELPTMANIQQPTRMLPPLFPDPPLRHPDPLDEIHQHPFRMFQDPSCIYFSPTAYLKTLRTAPSTCATYTSAFASATPSQLSASRFLLTRQKSTRFAT